ncbi:MAG: hypothetical protein V8Q91_08390 [Bilophila wadsworthia]|uniref:hypothetical protein n=1 Tax=Bilophila wadsworthia TaxID=35833 RepID=UPI00300E86AC
MRINGTVWSARDIAARIDYTVRHRRHASYTGNACALARAYGFKAVFTNPYWTPLVAELLDGSGIAAGISAAFPLVRRLPTLRSRKSWMPWPASTANPAPWTW